MVRVIRVGQHRFYRSTFPTMRSPKVFISYAKEDTDVARRVYRDLAAAGARPWIDAEDLLPGQQWKVEIESAIATSDFFLALLSTNSLNKRGYVQKEIRQALEVLQQLPAREIFLIQARLEECQPSHSALADLQWVDLFPDYQPGLEKILRVIRPEAAVKSGRLNLRLYDSEDLKQAGWGVLVPDGFDPSAREAIAPLIEHRESQAGTLFRELRYYPGESTTSFLTRYGVAPGPVDPKRLPLYLLILGGPSEIPFEFQSEIGIQLRVGRVFFKNDADYAQYAASLVSSESSSHAPKKAIFFGIEHPTAEPTRLAVRYLVDPLADSVGQILTDWEIQSLKGHMATRRSLARLLADDAPTLLFLVGNGLELPQDHPRRQELQGGLVFANLMGRSGGFEQYAANREDLFTAGDITDDTCLTGRVVFAFSDYSAGTAAFVEPEFDVGRDRGIPNEPFVSALVQRLLSLPNGAALGFIGNVGRAWATSFLWESAGPQLQSFEVALQRVLRGERLGAAMETFSERFAQLAALLFAEGFRSGTGSDTDAKEKRRRLGMAVTDAKNYLLFGDPAARLNLNGN